MEIIKKKVRKEINFEDLPAKHAFIFCGKLCIKILDGNDGGYNGIDLENGHLLSLSDNTLVEPTDIQIKEL